MEHFYGLLDGKNRVNTPQESEPYTKDKPVFSIFIDGLEIDQIYRTNNLKNAIEDRLFLKLLDGYQNKQIKVERLKTINEEK